MAKKLDTTYKSARFGNCTYALILDKRHPKKDKNTSPVVMRYTIDRKSWYNFVAGEFTEEDFATGRFRYWKPPQKTITMRIDLDNLDWLQSVGKQNYQSRLNNALRWARLNDCPVSML